MMLFVWGLTAGFWAATGLAGTALLYGAFLRDPPPK